MVGKGDAQPSEQVAGEEGEQTVSDSEVKVARNMRQTEEKRGGETIKLSDV